MEKTKRVAIYARVSTTDQTPENQLLDLRRYCSARGWTVVEEFVDKGISGAKKDRPALGRLMEATQRRLVDGVLVWKFDRFARSMSHLVSALSEFSERGISFTSYTEGIDTGTAQGKMVFGVIAAMAEFERDLITDRINASMRRLKASGVPLGRRAWKSRSGFLSESQIASILAERGKGSIRQIASRIGVGKSVVQKVLSAKDKQIVASAIDETPVAF